MKKTTLIPSPYVALWRTGFGEYVNSRDRLNLRARLYKGVRPAMELAGEEWPYQVTQTAAPYGLKSTTVNGRMFPSRRDLEEYTKFLLLSYADEEIIGGANERHLRDLLHQSGMLDLDASGTLFKKTEGQPGQQRMVIGFLGAADGLEYFYYILVIDRVPKTLVAAALVPLAAYAGPRKKSQVVKSIMAAGQRTEPLPDEFYLFPNAA